MKLLRVIASMDPATGGPCQGIRNSIPALERLGIQNEVVCLDEPIPHQHSAVNGEQNAVHSSRLANGDRFRVHALGLRRGPWGYHPALAPWLRENLSRFDAVIIHGLWLYPSFATWRALRKWKSDVNTAKHRAPLCFVMPHGMLDPWFQQARPMKAIRNTLYWKLVEHRVIRDAGSVLFTCEEEMRLARQPFRPYQPRRERVVGYGIPEPERNSDGERMMFGERFPALRDRSFVLFLSRIHPKKGIDLLLRAYAQISSTNLRSSPCGVPALVIAGPCADPAYLRSLKDLASSLGLPQCDYQSSDFPNSQFAGHNPKFVTWLPILSGDAKWGAFRACEAFILPSHQENFGIAVAEALACGKPVLISDKINIWREIEADGAGLVGHDTLEGIRGVLNGWLILDDRARETMAAAALRCFQNRFEIHSAAEAFFEVVRSEVRKTQAS